MELAPGATVRVGETILRVETDEHAALVPSTSATRFEGLIGSTPEMRELFAVLERVAGKSLSVLVQGDTGTGKEEVAPPRPTPEQRARCPVAPPASTTQPST